MTGKNRPEDVTKEERQLAKPCNFGLLYLMGNRGFYKYLRINFVPNISYEEACDLRARFFDGYPDMAQWQTEYARHAREQGFTQTVAGRRWRWKWRAPDPADVDEDIPFYEDVLIGFQRLLCRQSSGAGFKRRGDADCLDPARPSSAQRTCSDHRNSARRSGIVGAG